MNSPRKSNTVGSTACNGYHAAKTLRLFIPGVVLLCVLQSMSLLKTSFVITNAVNNNNNNNVDNANDFSSPSTYFRTLQSQPPSTDNEMEMMLADPSVAKAVADYYHRVHNRDSAGNENNDNIDSNHHGPYFQTHDMFRKEQERIDAISVEDRCRQFGVEPFSADQLSRLPLFNDTSSSTGTQQRRRRRIFFGSLIANESWELIMAHAIEVQNVYDVIALVEANTTQSGTPRQLRYGHGSWYRRQIQQGAMFGNQTKVIMGQWLHDRPELYDLAREVEQRNVVVDLWKEAGMTRDDIGILADVDEIISRDFLRALQVCDFPELRRSTDDIHDPPSCKLPKLVLSSIHFETTPGCIKQNEWYHPDVILGQCLEGIGDPTGRTVPVREIQRQYGQRLQSWGMHSLEHYPSEVLNSSTGLFPLFSGRDIRTVHGSESDLANYVDRPGMHDDAVWGAAFHFHNWFDGGDMEKVRHKYLTYGHPNWYAESHPLEALDDDIDMLVRCVHGLGNRINPDGRPYYDHEKALNMSLGGNRPIFFQNSTYLFERHSMVRNMILQDEAKYGPSYNATGRIRPKT